jgi:16S rRNA U1498 N3-methylase RsmE
MSIRSGGIVSALHQIVTKQKKKKKKKKKQKKKKWGVSSRESLEQCKSDDV